MDGGSALACEGKIKRTGGVLFSQRSLAAGSTLLRARCLRIYACVSLCVCDIRVCLTFVCALLHVAAAGGRPRKVDVYKVSHTFCACSVYSNCMSVGVLRKWSKS